MSLPGDGEALLLVLGEVVGDAADTAVHGGPWGGGRLQEVEAGESIEER